MNFSKSFALLVLLLSCLFFQSSAKAVSAIAPPFWWVGMKSNQLQLMLHGNNIGEFSIKSDSSELSNTNDHFQIKSVERSENPNYLWLNVTISARAKAGIYPIELINERGEIITLSYRLFERDSQSSQRAGFNQSDVIYLITPDRFVNGDYQNDQIEAMSEGINRDHEGGRYGGDLQGIIDNLDYLSQLGVTQLWLNPVLENAQQKYSYHGYSTTDYYRIDPRFGDNQLYRTLARKAKAKGIGIIKDVILNHIGSGHPWMQDMPSSDWINHGTHFVSTTHRRETHQDPYASQSDKSRMTDGWFVPSMPDLNQRNNQLAKYLIQNSIWWIEYAGLSGIRLDTYPYADKEFLTLYTQRLMDEYPKFNIVGEEWSYNPAILAYWQRGKRNPDGYVSYLPSLMDFPLHGAMINALNEEEAWEKGITKLYQMLATDFIYSEPQNLVVLADNHDMSRIHTLLNHDLALTKMALVFIATTRGIPQIFYGTEILMSNPKSDLHGVIRSEFPGGWKDHQKNAFTGKGLSENEKSMLSFNQKLWNWRKQNPIAQSGKLTHFAPENGVYVYFKTPSDKKPFNQVHKNHPSVMVVINKSNQNVKLNLQRFTEMLGSSTELFDLFDETSITHNGVIDISNKTAKIFTFYR